MQTTYKLRLYPTEEQEDKLLWTLEKCRLVYNDMLSRLYEQDKLGRLALQSLLPKFKEEYPEFKGVYSKVLQYEIYRLFSNLKALYQLKKKGRKVGRLRSKGKGWFKTFTYNQSGFKIIETGKKLDRLHLSKIGDIPIMIHRKVERNIKQVTIKRYSSGAWYACLSVNNDVHTEKKPVRKAVGIDVGIKYFAVDSNGNKIENPRFLNKQSKILRRQQKRLSRKKKDSNNGNKQMIRVAGVHERIKNQRDDFLHKLSRYYIDSYDMIAIEDLNVKGMVRNRRLARSISDASWSTFANMLSYKAENAGKTLVMVDPRNTSQVYKYGKLDRDYNASLNILKRGLQKIVGTGQTEFTPVDIEPLQKLYIVPASSVIESGNLLQNR